MSKGMDRKKEQKKKPAKTLEEKRALKRDKKANRGWPRGRPRASWRAQAVDCWKQAARDRGPRFQHQHQHGKRAVGAQRQQPRAEWHPHGGWLYRASNETAGGRQRWDRAFRGCSCGMPGRNV